MSIAEYARGGAPAKATIFVAFIFVLTYKIMRVKINIYTLISKEQIMKKLFLTLALCALMCALFMIGASAAAVSVTDDGSNVTLGDCTIAGLDGVTIPSPTRGLVYSLDDEAMTATVTGRGSFAGGTGVNLVFPSSVTYNGKTYTLNKINSGLFQRLTYNLYIPDSVTTIKGGGSVGTFGNSTIGDVYIGAGLTAIEQETFSGSKGFTAFVCKSKLKSVGVYAFNSCSKSGTLTAFELDLTSVVRFEKNAFVGASFLSGQSIEFGDCVEYFGEASFMSTGVSGSIVVPENCELAYRPFNGTSFKRVVIKVPKGQTRTLPAELFSGASAGLELIIDGNAIAGGDYLFSGNSTKLYMPTYEQVEALVESVVSFNSGKSRITGTTFYACDTQKAYKATSAGVISEETAEFSHAYPSESVVLEANCTYTERTAYVCDSCAYEKILSQGTELGDHVFETKTKLPSCQSIGYTEYDCTVCGLQEAGSYVDKASHSNTVKKYGEISGSTLEVSYYCEYCKTLDRTENVSLVNKCYIEGYGLFDATLDYVSVSADGVLTPSSATFDNAIIYFPSYVEVGGETVEVKTIKGFKAKSIKAIYVPDTVTRIVGGGGVGCFGDISTLKNIVVGKGVTELEQETFCIGGGATLDEFIFKGTITSLKKLCLSKVSPASADIPYEFNTKLIYVGYQVNLDGKIIREAHIAKGCDLSEGCAFNNANGCTTIYIEGGDTPEDALVLGLDFSSNLATTHLYIKGYVTTKTRAVLSGQKGTRIFMESLDAINVFASAIKAQGYASRIDQATFMDCSTDTAYYVSSSADAVVHPSVSFSHGGVIEETETSCTQGGSKVEKCFVCGEVVSETTADMLEHEYDGGVITLMPSCANLGTIEYTCITCGEKNELSIFHDYSTHEYAYFIAYVNGFDKAGEEGDRCSICKGTKDTVALDAIIIPIGYSVKNDRTGIDGGYQINKELLAKYEKQNGAVKLGIIIVNSALAESLGLVNEDFELISDKGIQVELKVRNHDTFSLSITGFNSDALKALDLLITSYVVADLDGDGVLEISYVQYTMTDKDNAPASFDGKTLNTVSIDRADPVAITPSAQKEEEQQ